MSTTALVEFVPLRTDLANLPNDLASVVFNSNTPAQNVVLEIIYSQGLRSEQKAFMGWSGMTSAKVGSIEVDPTFAQNIGLAYHTKVSIKLHVNPPIATQIFLKPATTADWEIVETHVAFLENWMINQVRAVSLLHPITVYPSATSIACLQVTKINPPPSGPFAKLGPESEVIIAPKIKKKEKTEERTPKKEKEEKKRSDAIVTRACAWPYGNIEGSESRQPVLYGDFPIFGDVVGVSLVSAAGATELQQRPQEKIEDDAVQPAKTIAAKLVQRKGKPVLSYGLRCALRESEMVGIIIKISPIASPSKKPVTYHPYSITSNPQSLKLGEDKNGDFLNLELVSNGMVIPPTPEFAYGGIVEAPEDFAYAAKVTIGSENLLPESQVQPTPEMLLQTPTRKVVGRDCIIKQTLEACMSGSGTLVYGSIGCGKTAIVERVVHLLQHDYAIHVARFNCGSYVDKPISQVRDAFRRTFLNAGWRAPSVVLMEDLDKLIEAQLEHSDSTRSEQLSEILQTVARRTMKNRKITLFASAQSKEALESSLLSSHLFDELIHVRSPDKQMRETVLLEAMTSLGLSMDKTFDILDVVSDTEGYQPGDLWTLTERIAALMALEDSSYVTNALLKQATDEYTPASLRGVKLEKSSVTWTEIGGLAEVKKVILETLEWPTKYAPIFANCPLRLRSGLLLYGYPGCGKTLIASAVAAQCGLNFISVKGPEILNKYIGASEQSVRDLFDRAQAAKPCVLFFDEFDSIAPKRGHDSTGVTDRVVNQMLTQMDGAEGLDGVYVLAATSRPDLIDGALLRPGRLDKSLLCDMPSLEDRMEIFKTTENKMSLSSDVDLADIAKRTEGYSGADLQAIMTNAYLYAIHSVIDQDMVTTPAGDDEDIEMFSVGNTKSINPELTKNYVAREKPVSQSKGATQKTGKVVVTRSHLERSLEETKPSISKKEALKLKNIYQQFVSDRDGQMPPGTSSTDIGGRVTLQ